MSVIMESSLWTMRARWALTNIASKGCRLLRLNYLVTFSVCVASFVGLGASHYVATCDRYDFQQANSNLRSGVDSHGQAHSSSIRSLQQQQRAEQSPKRASTKSQSCAGLLIRLLCTSDPRLVNVATFRMLSVDLR